jgi:hypothetical protein
MKYVVNPFSGMLDAIVLMEGKAESSLPSSPPSGTWRFVLLTNGDLYLQTAGEDYIMGHGYV